jgi:hypothetical protein
MVSLLFMNGANWIDSYTAFKKKKKKIIIILLYMFLSIICVSGDPSKGPCLGEVCHKKM